MHTTPLVLYVTNSYLADGTVLTELELVPTLLMRNKVGPVLAGENVSFLGSSKKMIHGNMVGMDYHRLLIQEMLLGFKKKKVK
jgi:hypothetical protein